MSVASTTKQKDRETIVVYVTVRETKTKNNSKTRREEKLDEVQ